MYILYYSKLWTDVPNVYTELGCSYLPKEKLTIRNFSFLKSCLVFKQLSFSKHKLFFIVISFGRRRSRNESGKARGKPPAESFPKHHRL